MGPLDASIVLFDLDGTLVDSATDIAHTLNRTLASLGLPPLPVAAVRGMIGAGAPMLIDRALAASGAPSTWGAEALARYLELYADAPVEFTRPYPGIVETLDALGRRGARLGICTNKPLQPTRAVLAHLGLGGFFAAVVAGDSLGVRKPDPAPLRHAIAALDGEARDAVLVGDTLIDAQAAQAAGTAFALVSWGYHRGELGAIPRDLLLDDLRALPDWLEGRTRNPCTM